jgi:outer membrane protein OmpA-like peptidoglycan-associated protein
MRRILFALLILLTLTSAAEARQTTSTQTQDQRETRPATASVSGDTGLWFLPTAEILPSGKWSVSFYRANADFGQGFTDVSNWPLSVAYGVGNRVELFGSWTTVTRIDRDTRPLFFAPIEVGSGGGVVNEYPMVRQQWSGNSRGDLRVGAKLNLLSQANDNPVAFALKGTIKLPTGNEDTGASTGKSDWAVDAILSGEAGSAIELTATAGYVKRGDPDGFELMNGIRWGVGAAFPSRSPLRVTTEIHGERYVGSGGSNRVIAPANFAAEDGSIAPIETIVKHPLYVAAGLTYQSSGGFFIGGGLNWSSAVKDRVVGDNGFRDKLGIQFRIGYHPGVRTSAVAMAAPAVETAAPAVAAPTVSAPPANRPPTARATCDPCTVEVGKTSTITGTCSDPDGDTLTYRWVTNSGTIANPNVPQTTWTAPMNVGPVPITLTCTDPAGLSANADVTINVVQPAVKEYVFEDVHFDFDRNTLRPDALAVLDEAVKALQATPTLKLQVEGHTCNIGTAEYNMALANRRAVAVRDYLASRGITADRLSVVSYGEERPKHDNEREETRRLNRRAALVVSVVR